MVADCRKLLYFACHAHRLGIGCLCSLPNRSSTQWLLYGIKPVIIAIVLQALWKLGKKAAKDLPTTIAGVGSGGLLRWIERNFAAGVARNWVML